MNGDGADSIALSLKLPCVCFQSNHNPQKSLVEAGFSVGGSGSKTGAMQGLSLGVSLGVRSGHEGHRH